MPPTALLSALLLWTLSHCSQFSSISEAEVSLLLGSLPCRQCELHPTQTPSLKDYSSDLVLVIANIINLQLSTGNFCEFPLSSPYY